jgi:hypothetical protein
MVMVMVSGHYSHYINKNVNLNMIYDSSGELFFLHQKSVNSLSTRVSAATFMISGNTTFVFCLNPLLFASCTDTVKLLEA